MQLALQQEQAMAKVVAWLRMRYAPFFYLAGFAGTGKTTIAKMIAAQVHGEVRYAAFTGKAAKVLRSKGCDGASTIHSLIYLVDRDKKTGKLKTILTGQNVRGAALIIIDECSMVNEEVGRDLLSFGIPVLVLGDPGQLPPVDGAGFFTSGEPSFMLTDVHRQAAESPIIRLATEVREGRFSRRPSKEPGLTVVKRIDLDPAVVPAADTVIVGINKTRQSFNKRLREIRGFTSDMPVTGETLMCLRNDHQLGIANGEIFRVKAVGEPQKTDAGRLLDLRLEDPDQPKRPAVPVQVFEHFFQGQSRIAELDWRARRGKQEFDFGYAMTCHKSQGSQWDDIVVFDESAAFREDAPRWLYTALTRAAQSLTLVI